MEKSKCRVFWPQITQAMALMVPLLTASQGMANPSYSHVVVVVEENHGYNDIIGDTTDAPYINDVLSTGGVCLTNAYGEQHPSQPNYDWLFSGSNQGITSDENLITNFGSNAPFNSPNLYTELQTNFAGTSQSNNFFGGYVDQYPGASNAYAHQTNDYVTRHVPWLGFNNINNGDPAGITQDFTNSPLVSGNFNSLPVLSFVIPCLTNDMHYAAGTNLPDEGNNANGTNNLYYSQQAIAQGDLWLSNNLSAYASWAKSNNSLLIVTWDEDHLADWTVSTNGTNTPPQNPDGLTAPDYNGTNYTGTNAISNTNYAGTNSGPNQIPMIFYGANLATNGLVGTFGANSNGVNNLNLYDTLQSFYSISDYGTQSDVAANAGLTNAPITDIFAVPEPSTVALAGLGAMALLIAARRRWGWSQHKLHF